MKAILGRQEHIVSALSALRRGSDRPVIRRAVLLLSLVVFIIAAVVSFDGISNVGRTANWWLVIMAGLLGTLASQLLNSFEFREIGRASGTEFTIAESVRVSVIGAAANLLPIPGSVLVRVSAISRRGGGAGRGAAMSLGVGGYFVGTTLVIAGLAQIIPGRLVLGVSWVTLGLMTAAVSGWILRPSVTSATWGLHLRVVVIEATLIVTGGLRMWLVLLGLGFEVSLSQTVGLTVAGALTTAVGFFPGGLGLKELLVAGVSPLVGLSATAGLAVAVIDRFFRMVMLSIVSLAMLITKRESRTIEEGEEVDDEAH